MCGAVSYNTAKRRLEEVREMSEEDCDQDFEIKEIIKKAFDAYDEDGSGFLEKPEIRRLLDDACKELGTPIITEEHLNKIIDVVDNNADGKFSVDELSSIIKPILKKQIG